MNRRSLIPLAFLPLAGCAQWNDVRSDARAELARTSDDPECDATAVQGLIGQRVDTEMGERLRKGTGAKLVRWAPPDSALTMDYRPDRLTVAYDHRMAITRISCG